MPDDTDQPTRRTGRGTLLIVLLAAVIGAGLWYVLEQPGTGEPVGDAAPAAGDSRTADAGTPRTTDSDTTPPADDVQTTDAGTTPPADDVQTTDAGTTPPAGDVQTADAGSAPQAPGAQTADADTTPQADGVQTADAGSAPQAPGAQTADADTTPQAPGVQTADADTTPQAPGVQTADAGSAPQAPGVQTAGAGATPQAGDVQTADAGSAPSAGDVQTADAGATDPTGAAPSTDSGTASGAPRIASADPGTAPVEEAHVVAAAPEDTIEKTPVDAPPAAETTGETDLLAAVDRLIERVETAIQERLDTEPEVDSDTELRVQVTYDDSQEDEPKTDVAPDEATRTADSDAMLPAADAPAPDSDAADPTGATRTADFDASATSASARTIETDAADPTGATRTADFDASATSASARTVETDAADPTGATWTADFDASATSASARTVETDAADPTGATRTADFDASATSASARTVETDAADPTGAAPSTDSGTASGAPRIASADPGTAPVEEAHVVAAAPEDTIEKTPVDAPPAAETTGETDLLAAVDRLIERVETAIRERLDTEPEVDSDTDLRVQVTYDDSQEDEPKTDVAPPDEATRTADSDATLPAADAPAPDSDGAAPTDVAESPDSDGEAPTDVAGSPDSDGEAPTDVAGSPDSDGEAPTDVAESSKSDGAVAQDAADTAASDSAEAEAKKYVETLTETAPQTIPVDKADHFVTQERVVSLVPEDTIESVSVEELAKDETLSPDTPITVVREVEQIETAVPEQLIAESGGDLDQPLRVTVTYDDSQDEAEPGDSRLEGVEQDVVEQITVREALERIAREPEKPLSVIKTVRYFEVMTLKELLDREWDGDGFLTVVTQPYRIESATLADLLQRHKAENPDSIFYLHTVLPTDDQGIWGIIHFGLIENFARGMAIRRGEDVETYTVEIPRHADERLDDRSSSFLGKLIDRKTKNSYVYNYRENRMGRNPDRIYPGQELVIINFELGELKAIHKHFASS